MFEKLGEEFQPRLPHVEMKGNSNGYLRHNLAIPQVLI